VASDIQSANEPSMASLVNGIISDGQELMKQQFQLLRAEVRDDFKKTREAAFPLVAGAIVSFVGAIFLGLTAVYLLYWACNPTPGPGFVERFPLWGCYAVVTGVVLALGLGMVVYGRQKFASFNPLPDETAKGVQETLEWKTNPK
jgi:hypothetical protein